MSHKLVEGLEHGEVLESSQRPGQLRSHVQLLLDEEDLHPLLVFLLDYLTPLRQHLGPDFDSEVVVHLPIEFGVVVCLNPTHENFLLDSLLITSGKIVDQLLVSLLDVDLDCQVVHNIGFEVPLDHIPVEGTSPVHLLGVLSPRCDHLIESVALEVLLSRLYLLTS